MAHYGQRRRNGNSLLRRALRVVIMTSVAVVVIMLIPPLRNVMLLPVWPRHWRDVSSVDILRMYTVIKRETPLSFPDEVTCPQVRNASRVSTNLSMSQEAKALAEYLHLVVSLFRNAKQPDGVLPDPDGYFSMDTSNIEKEVIRIWTLASEAYQKQERQKKHVETWLAQSEIREASFGKFRPLMNPTEFRAAVLLLFVFDLACRAAGVRYLMMAGSLLGVHRHHGYIPWDNDIDLAIDSTQADVAMRVLSCIPGYTLKVVHGSGAQWKLFPNLDPRTSSSDLDLNTGNELGEGRAQHTAVNSNPNMYPFLDIFISHHDDNHLWSLTTFTFTKDMTLKMGDLFPFSTAKFEGGVLPVPGKTTNVLGRLYDVEVCVSPVHDHKTHTAYSGSDVTILKCSELSDMYTLFNVS